jgi:hypothetical protein
MHNPKPCGKGIAAGIGILNIGISSFLSIPEWKNSPILC